MASAVGATVLTDTIALVVLAVVAGTEPGTGSRREIALQLGVGMAVLLIVRCWCCRGWRAGRSAGSAASARCAT